MSDLVLSFFFPSGNFERFFFHFFRKKTRRRKDTQEKKKKKKKKRLELVILTLYYVNVCSLSIKTTLSLQNLLCIQIMRKKSSSSSDSDFLSLSLFVTVLYISSLVVDGDVAMM